jgi:hypothetical protein
VGSRKARTGRNPQTGAAINPHFSPRGNSHEKARKSGSRFPEVGQAGCF